MEYLQKIQIHTTDLHYMSLSQDLRNDVQHRVQTMSESNSGINVTLQEKKTGRHRFWSNYLSSHL